MPPARPPNIFGSCDLELWPTGTQSWSFHAIPRAPLVPICIKIGSFVFNNIAFTSLVTDERTDGRTDGRTGRQHIASVWQSGLVEAQKQAEHFQNMFNTVYTKSRNKSKTQLVLFISKSHNRYIIMTSVYGMKHTKKQSRRYVLSNEAHNSLIFIILITITSLSSNIY